MAPRQLLFVDWKVIAGAAQHKRKLVLKKNEKEVFTCPVKDCLHRDFKSKRGLRKHIDTKHSWYYYFDTQPSIKREEIEALQPTASKKATTTSKPYYTIDKGIGNDFFKWLCTSCGGGKNEKEGKQIAKRAMKFLMECAPDNEDSLPLTKDLVDCCLGSPTIIMRFLTALETQWKLTFSSALSYVKAITDLVDFRKANGVNDDVLRCFAVTEVYLRRAKENFRKKKQLECTRNYDLETLISQNSWATIEEMENVIPFHMRKFKEIVEKCKVRLPIPSKQELSFCTRFLTAFLFLRVKCSRPMTFQYLTLTMINKARTNDGFIDQTEFKTSLKYSFDTLIITPDTFTILDVYIDYVRPLFNPVCDFLLVSHTGNQYQSLTTAMTLIVHEAIGKYINPTRYRQIIETTSSERLSKEEQDIISEDQKHSSSVAKIYYKKKQSRNVAIEGKRCMDKMLGETRNEKNTCMTDLLSELDTLKRKFDKHPVLENSQRILSQETSSSPSNPISPFVESCTITSPSQAIIIERTQELMSSSQLPSRIPEEEPDLIVTNTICPPADKNEESSFDVEKRISNNVLIKKEEVKKRVGKMKNKKFSAEEDAFLRRGIEKYGKKNWSSILKDKSFSFHDTRSRDSLRMRAESSAFKKLCL